MNDQPWEISIVLHELARANEELRALLGKYNVSREDSMMILRHAAVVVDAQVAMEKEHETLFGSTLH